MTEASYEQFLQHLEAGEAQDALRAALIVPGTNAARIAYCSTLAEQCLELANWVGFDSIIGGGSVGSDGESRGGSGRFDDFRGLVVVCQMLAELVSGAVRLQEADLYYAGAGLVRQVIECEYLLAAFDEDFSTAGQWSEPPHRTFESRSSRSNCESGRASTTWSTGIIPTWEDIRAQQERSYSNLSAWCQGCLTTRGRQRNRLRHIFG